MKKLLLTVIFLFSNLAQADFITATKAYQEGKFEDAYRQFLSMAKLGEKQSQFNVGVMYYQGQFVNKDINKAYAWIKLATESETMKPSEKKVFKTISEQIPDLHPAEKEYQQLAALYSSQVLLDKLIPQIVDISSTGAYDAVPINIIYPKYPKKAAMNGIQGWTRFYFDLDKLGVPRNILLVESFPDNVFSKISIRAIKKWNFKPAHDQKGNAVAKRGFYYTLQFRLGGADPITLKKGIYEKNMLAAQQGNAIAQYNIGFWEKKLNLSKGKQNPVEWFLKSAIQGDPGAQYELGSSLIYGKGCRQDKAKGMEWLTRAAQYNQSDARQLLANIGMQKTDHASQFNALEYLNGVNKTSARTKLNYAWMLATSPFEDVANPKKSLEVLDDLNRKIFSDDATLYEIKAAAYAAMGNFKKALSYQKDALEEAEDRKADVTTIKQHLASYQNKKKWF